MKSQVDEPGQSPRAPWGHIAPEIRVSTSAPQLQALDRPSATYGRFYLARFARAFFLAAFASISAFVSRRGVFQYGDLHFGQRGAAARRRRSRP